MSAGLLGWRPPVRSTAQLRDRRAAPSAIARAWRELTGIDAARLEARARARAGLRAGAWFAELYFLKPLVFGVFALFWIATGLISLGPGWEIGMSLVRARAAWASLSRR